MGFPTLVRCHLYIGSAPSCLMWAFGTQLTEHFGHNRRKPRISPVNNRALTSVSLVVWTHYHLSVSKKKHQYVFVVPFITPQHWLLGNNLGDKCIFDKILLRICTTLAFMEWYQPQIPNDGLMQDCSISISDALELLQYCTNPAKYGIHVHRLLS